MTDYNYATFDLQRETPPFADFVNALHVGQRAPDFPLEDLDSGKTLRMKELWTGTTAILEFGSFT